MRSPETRISFIRAVMAGFLTGIAAAIVMSIFVLIYRSVTGVNAFFFLISPVFMFIGIPIILALAGMLLFIIARYFSRGLTWFIVLFVLLTAFGIIVSISQNNLAEGAKGLLIGLEIIAGLSAAIVIPYLARHPNSFMTKLGRNASS